MTKLEIAKQLREQRYTYKKIGEFLGMTKAGAYLLLHGNNIYRKKSNTAYSILDIKEFPEVDISKIEVKLYGRNYARELVRIRDNHTCQICHHIWKEGERRLDVHHIDCNKEKTQQIDNFDIEKNNMITLCHKCHANLESHRKEMSKGKTTKQLI